MAQRLACGWPLPVKEGTHNAVGVLQRMVLGEMNIPNLGRGFT